MKTKIKQYAGWAAIILCCLLVPYCVSRMYVYYRADVAWKVYFWMLMNTINILNIGMLWFFIRESLDKA